MSTFNIARETAQTNLGEATLFRVSFGEPGTNVEIVVDATAGITDAMQGITGGRLALISGPASLAAAVAIGHKLTHLFGAIGVFDPKLQGFVVAVSHDPSFTVGDLLQEVAHV